MNILMKFENKELGDIRALQRNGEPWFVGTDVAKKLGYADPRSTVSRKIDDEDRGVAKITTPSGIQEMTIINESGLYSLILGSKLPEAKKFKKWVTSEVLPQIRKTGSYNAEFKGQEKMFKMLESKMEKALNDAVREMEEKCSQFYRPTSLQIYDLHSYIKNRLGIKKVNDEYFLVKQRVLLILGAKKWEDVPVETLINAMPLIDESIRVIKIDRPTEQVSFF